MSEHERSMAINAAERSAYLDNAKGMLIVLVVFGHVISFGMDTFVSDTLYKLIYAFHMPAFAVVTGYLARPDISSPKRRSRFVGLITALVVFQGLHVLLMFLARGDLNVPRTMDYPAYTLWWLLSLACWQLVLPLFSQTEDTWQALRFLAGAAAVAIWSGYFIHNGTLYSLSRTFMYFPFFLGGYYAARHGWKVARTRWNLIAALAAFAIAGWFLSTLDTGLVQDWLQGRKTFSELDIRLRDSLLLRAGVMALNITLVAAFLRLVPRRRLPITSLGVTTLSVYVWHGLALNAARLWEVRQIADSWPEALGLTVLLVGLLGYGPIPALTLRLFRGPAQRRRPHQQAPAVTPSAQPGLSEQS